MAMYSRSFTFPKKFTQKHVGATVVLIVIAVYFAFYMLYGNRGFFTLSGLNDDIRLAQNHLDELVVERQEIEDRVKMMRPNSVDIDMMSEQIRKEMRYAHPDDIIVDVK